MSTNRVVIYSLVGKAAGRLLRACRKWRRATVRSERCQPTGYRSWRRTQIAVRENAYHPPVVFYVEYYDTWSMFLQLIYFLLDSSTSCRWRDFGNGEEAVLVPSGGFKGFRQHLDARVKIFAEHDREMRFFVRCLTDAVESAKPWGKGCVVVAFTCLGASVYDEEIKAGLAGLPPWMGKKAKRYRLTGDPLHHRRDPPLITCMVPIRYNADKVDKPSELHPAGSPGRPGPPPGKF